MRVCEAESFVSLLMAHAAPGYRVGLDMLMRVAVDSELAPDACLYPIERDAEGHRQLAELVFEVLATERRAHASRKAQLFAARGVRRILAVDVRWSQVLEWDHSAQDWRLLPGSTIEDRCLVRPLATDALRGIGTSDETLEGWVTQGHPVVRREVDRARADGQREAERIRADGQREAERIRVEGLREAIADLCEAYGVALTGERRERLRALPAPELEALRAQLKQRRAWPES